MILITVKYIQIQIIFSRAQNQVFLGSNVFEKFKIKILETFVPFQPL